MKLPTDIEEMNATGSFRESLLDLAGDGEAYRAVVDRQTDTVRPQPQDALGRADRPDRCQHRGVRLQQPHLGRHPSRHHRWPWALLAARKLGLKEVPVIVLDHLSEAQKRAYIIADNQLALNAGWDEELLRVELATLQAEDFNIGLIGFEDDELARLLADTDAGGLTDEDAVPDPPEDPVTRTGDLWLLGPHRVLCGDATAADAVLRVCGAPGSRPQPFLMVTDPPYGIELDSEWRDRAGLNGCGPAEASYMKKRTVGTTETTISGDTRADWSEAFELVPSLEGAYVCHASKFTREVLDGLLQLGFLHHQQIIWNKGRPGLTPTPDWYQHEPCRFVRKKNAPRLGK